MAKFIFYTDIHFAAETPRHRRDDFAQTLLEKQRTVYALAEREKCDFVAFGGDYFNSHRIFSFPIISETIDIVAQSKLKTYMVVGEHDLYGHNFDSLPNSTLAFFRKFCPNAVIVDGMEEPVPGVRLWAKHEPDKIEDILAKVPVSEGKNGYDVMLCHELLTNQHSAFEIVDTRTLPQSGFDLVLSGDLHCGYPIHTAKGTVFANPGSLARRTTADRERMPQVALVELADGKVNVKYIVLECGKSGEEVFDCNEDAGGEIVGEPTDFTRDLLELESQTTDVFELIKGVAAKEGISEAALSYIMGKRVLLQKEAAQ